MYKVAHFKETDETAVLSFMKAHPFVTLIGYNGQCNVATQIPVLIDEQEGILKLRGHVMRNTDHHKALEQNPDVLVLFHGPHCYISSGWYTQKMGATWNYQTVHVNGNARIMSHSETAQLLTELTEHFEKGQQQPLYVSGLPEGYMDKLIPAIAGVEITVTDIYPIFKLSQNRDDESYQNIIHHLSLTNDTDAHKIVEEMKKRRPHLFQ